MARHSSRHERDEEEDRKPTYVDIEAEESDAEEDGYDDGEDLIDFVAHDESELEEYDEAPAERPEKTKLSEINIDELGERIVERYKRGKKSTGIDPSQIERLPTRGDPRLWILRCRHGKEESVLNKIAGRYEAAKDAGKPFPVTAALQKNGLRGYIYIEAFRKTHVIEAVQNIRGINTNYLMCVPQEEMIDVLSCNRRANDIKKGSFCRVRQGKYQGDLAQVVDVSETRDIVRIRLVPRHGDAKHGMTRRLFDAKQHTGAVRTGDYWIYKKNTYKDGFLEKDVLHSMLDFENIEMSFEEHEMFGTEMQKSALSEGERVRAVRGNYVGEIGTIKSRDGETLVVQTDGETLVLSRTDVEKHFSAGDDAYICRGPARGKHGVVVFAGSDLLVVSCDNFTTQVEVSPADCSATEQRSTKERALQTRQARTTHPRSPLLHKNVRIVSGEHKGKYGVVKAVYEDTCKVLLFCSLQHATVALHSISAPDVRSPRSEGIQKRAPKYSPVREKRDAGPRKDEDAKWAYETEYNTYMLDGEESSHEK